MAEEVASHDLDAVRQLGAQRRRQTWIDFHACQRAFKTCERNGERTVARADLDDGSAGAGHAFDDAGDDGSVGEEVLAVLMTAVTIGRHWLLRVVGAGHGDGPPGDESGGGSVRSGCSPPSAAAQAQ